MIYFFDTQMKEKVSSDAVEMVDQAVKLSIALEGVTIVRKGPQDIITDGKNGELNFTAEFTV